MKILKVYLINGSDFQTDATTVTYRDWGITCYAQEMKEDTLSPTFKTLYIPWINIKFCEELSV